MAYTKTTWVNNSTDVTAERMNNLENGVSNNDTAITALTKKTSFTCTPASGFTITSQNCYKINNEIVFNVDVKRTNNLDITATTQMFFTLPYKPSAEFPVTTVARSSAYGLMNSFVQTIVNTNGQVWSLVGSACGYVSISGRFEI